MNEMTNRKIKEKLLHTANAYKFESVVKDIEAFRAEELETRVAFLGEFSSGKSSLVNALIKRRFLPMFDKPTTAVVTEIRKGAENKIEVVSYEDGEVSREIEPSELAKEVQKTQLNNKIRISLADSDLIDTHTVLIDTPGVSSLNETHSDVTYGYLPNVDVAFVVVNINMGSVSESLLKFINQYPAQVKNRIKFVLTHVDTKSIQEINKVKNEFQDILSTVIDQPEIFLVSSKMALEANNSNNLEKYKESGVLAIESIIERDIPSYKENIKQERERKFLLEQAQNLISGLEELYRVMQLDTSEIKKEKDQLNEEQNELRSELKKLKSKVARKEEDIKSIAKEVASDFGIQILNAAVAGEDVSLLTRACVDEIQNLIIEELNEFEFFSPKKVVHGLQSKINASIQSKLMTTIKTTNTIVGIANLGMIAAIAPGAGLVGNAAEMGGSALIKTTMKRSIASVGKQTVATGAQALLTEAAGMINNTDNSDESKSENGVTELTKTQKAAVFATNILNQFDVLGKLSKRVMGSVMEKKASNAIVYPVNRQISSIFNILNEQVDQVIKLNFIEPLRMKEEALKVLQEKEFIENKTFEQQKDSLRTDIQLLKVL